MVGSITYLITMTAVHDYSTLVTIYGNNELFNALYRRPFGPAGYSAFGSLMAIFYYEFHKTNTER